MISPDSLRFPRGQDKIDHLTAMGRRIVSLMFRMAPETELHRELSKRDWIDFSDLGGDHAPVAGAADHHPR
ncbi:MAG: hypothetical protein ACFB6R_11640 [Alphaproteobacteria bacterium]